MSLAWGKVGITTWRHKINGLTESDFILAAKIDKLYKPQNSALRPNLLRRAPATFFLDVTLSER